MEDIHDVRRTWSIGPKPDLGIWERFLCAITFKLRGGGGRGVVVRQKFTIRNTV